MHNQKLKTISHRDSYKMFRLKMFAITNKKRLLFKEKLTVYNIF